MPEIDSFATSLLEEAKRFLEKANSAQDRVARDAYAHSALLLGFCSLEAHVNAIAEEMCIRKELTSHERGLLLEREVKLEDGEFVVQSGLRMARLEDRISFLATRFSGRPLDTTSSWWSGLRSASILRNELSHPKGAPAIAPEEVRRALDSVVQTLGALYQCIYRRKFPAAARGLTSRLHF